MDDKLDKDIEDLEYQLRKLSGYEDRTEKLKHKIAELTKQEFNTDKFIQETSSSLAVAAVQQIIKSAAANSKVEISSIQPLDNYSDDLYPRVTLRARMKADINAIHDIVYELESSQPVTILTNIDIKNINAINNPEEESDNRLNVRMDISSYYLASRE